MWSFRSDGSAAPDSRPEHAFRRKKQRQASVSVLGLERGVRDPPPTKVWSVDRDEYGPRAMADAVYSISGKLGRFHIDDKHWIVTMAVSDQHTNIMRYNLERLIRVGGLFSMFVSGTVFTMDLSLYKNLAMMIFVATLAGVIIGLVLPKDEVAKYDMTALSQLVDLMSAFVPFVLAVYVSLALSRWWDLRVKAAGALFEGLANVVMILSACVPGKEAESARMQVIKYGMASISITIMAARSNVDMDSLVDDELLTNEETQAVSDIPPFQRAMVLWLWIARISDQVLSEASQPAGRQNLVLGKVAKARNGINTIHTYLDTQLPFAYVHLITWIVNVQNLTLAAQCGVAFVKAFASEDIEQLVNQVVTLLLVGTIYQGLLSISYVVQDPFGDDLLDLSLCHFVHYIAQSCLALERGAMDCPGLKRLGFQDTMPVVRQPSQRHKNVHHADRHSFADSSSLRPGQRSDPEVAVQDAGALNLQEDQASAGDAELNENTPIVERIPESQLHQAVFVCPDRRETGIIETRRGWLDL